MNGYPSCSCCTRESVENFLRWAPCPPPTMSFEDFRNHALDNKLEIGDICLISRRCIGIASSVGFSVDCPPSIFDCHEPEEDTAISIIVIIVISIIGFLVVVLVILIVIFLR